jgi:hypothetical protein
MLQVKSVFYLMNGMSVPFYSFIINLLIAINCKPSVRGEFAYLYAVMSFLSVIFFGAISSQFKLETTQRMNSFSDRKLIIHTFKSFALSLPILGILYLSGRIDLANLFNISLAAATYGALTIRQQMFLRENRKFQAFIYTSFVWLFYLLVVLLFLKLFSDRVSSTNLFFILSMICTLTLLTSIKISPYKIPLDPAESQLTLIDKGYLGSYAYASVLQINGLVIVFDLLVSKNQLAILSVSLSFLNALLVAGVSLINMQIWEKRFRGVFQNAFIWIMLSIGMFFAADLIVDYLPLSYGKVLTYTLAFFPIYTAYYLNDVRILPYFNSPNMNRFILIKIQASISLLVLVFFIFYQIMQINPINITVVSTVYLLVTYVTLTFFEKRFAGSRK